MLKVYLDKIDRNSCLELKEWANFEDPRLVGYNYGDLTDFDLRLWYGTITMPNKRYFAVRRYEDDRFVGFIGLKNINPILRRAKLGVVFDANFVSMGYGYESLRLMMEYFFKEMSYKTLLLEVNLFNTRAIKTYTKAGFKEFSFTKEVFENQEVEFDDRYFEKSRGLIYSKIMVMKITREEFNELQDARLKT